jgi:peptidoglycan/LPS O-acetylase OafA/YrhL
VLVYHAAFELAWNGPFDRLVAKVAMSGWIGVDIFFVISGFLITGILLDTQQKANRLRIFYARRFLRIIPPYYLLLTIVFVILPYIVPFDSEGLRTIQNRQAWLWFHLTNLSFIFYRQVWTTAGWLNLGHLWSLAIEEQFYLVWPMVVFSLNRKRLKSVCVALVFISFALRFTLWCLGQHNSAIYFPTPCRLDGLAMGSLVALLIRENTADERIIKSAWIVGGGAIAGAISLSLLRGGFPFNDKPAVVFGVTLISAIAASLIMLIASSGRHSRKLPLLTNSILRSIGKYSYAMYLFHGVLLYPLKKLIPPGRIVATIGSEWAGNAVFGLIFILVSYGVALISWHLWERHWLTMKSRFRYSEHERAPLTYPALTPLSSDSARP